MQLIYNATKKEIIALFDAPDLNMRTGQTVFEGTLAECKAKIEELNLTTSEENPDPYIVERIFRAKKGQIRDNKMPLMPDNDLLPLDELEGIKVHEDEEYTYMKCNLTKESLEAMLENTGEDDLNANVVVGLGITNAYVGESKANI